MTLGPRVGVLAASLQQWEDLTRLVKGAGCELAAAYLLSQPAPEVLPEADCWLVNLDLQEPSVQAVIDQLDERDVPVIFDEEAPEELDDLSMEAWRLSRERRLAAKLKQLVRELPAVIGQTPRRRAEWVWVLGASTGGPEAVVQFLKALPAVLPGVAFLYVQHMDQRGMANLQRVMAKQSPWPVEHTDVARVVREQTVYLVAPVEQIELSDSGVISPNGTAWCSRFRPCIDQVVAKVARIYGARGGAIIFSGMGDDGAKSCSLLHKLGGRVWVQSAESCTVDSMPVSVQARGCADFAAEPSELARQLVRLHHRLALAKQQPHLRPG